MIRLHVAVEGPTEELFVKRTVVPHLAARAVFTDVLVVNPFRHRTGRKLQKGGGHWSRWREDIRRLLLDRSPDLRVTTLFDLYGLPPDFPRLEEHSECTDTAERVDLLERALADDIADRRLIAYLQRHEFEAMVLAGLDELCSLLDTVDRAGLDALRSDVGSTPPEDVDDGVESAPSKRLRHHIPAYSKTLHGPAVVEALGLARLRSVCPRFDRWLSGLEALGSSPFAPIAT